MRKGVVKLLASWQGKFGRCSHVAIWSMIPRGLMWGIWWERNAMNFKGCEKSIPDLKFLFLKTLFEWINASGLFSFVTLLDSCTFSV